MASGVGASKREQMINPLHGVDAAKLPPYPSVMKNTLPSNKMYLAMNNE